MLHIGIDLGTSGMKFLLVDAQGRICNRVVETYPTHFPQQGWSEQEPEDWWRVCIAGVRRLMEGFDVSQVAAIGCGGQMHGLVALNESGISIRPAILWNDGRASAEAEHLNKTLGKRRLCELTGNIAYAGFTAPKVLWMQSHEPECFAGLHYLMLPKDYLNYRLTGAYTTDCSDAGGTLLFDGKNRKWSEEMLGLCGLNHILMPQVYESWEVIGTLRKEVAEAMRLPATVQVVAGAGDNAAAAIGTGTVAPGACNISVGTSGTVFIAADGFPEAGDGALHIFPHATGRYHLLGCVLSAASCLKWYCENVLQTDAVVAEQCAINRERLGRNGVFFLPYLMGERSPINDADARGLFIGMTMATSRADMVQAVMEGVAFAIRDNLEVAKAMGITIQHAGLCGGGSRSALWREILANVLGIALELPRTEEGPAYGGAMLAMIGTGCYETVEDCVAAMTETAETVLPDRELAERYEEQYRKYRKIYPAVRPLFRTLR